MHLPHLHLRLPFRKKHAAAEPPPQEEAELSLEEFEARVKKIEDVLGDNSFRQIKSTILHLPADESTSRKVIGEKTAEAIIHIAVSDIAESKVYDSFPKNMMMGGAGAARVYDAVLNQAVAVIDEMSRDPLKTPNPTLWVMQEEAKQQAKNAARPGAQQQPAPDSVPAR